MYDNIENERTSIGMSLRSSSPAFPYIESLENRSGFMKVVVEDFLKANKNPEGYAELPEKERLEKFFRVKKSREEASQAVRKYAARMKAGSKQRLVYEAVYIRLLRLYGKIFICGVPLEYFIVQFAVSSTEKLVKDGITGGSLDYAFFTDINRFAEQCRANQSDTGWLENLAKREQSFDEAERLFALLADHWFTVCGMLPGAEAYTAEQAADSILDFLESHPESGYMGSGYAVSEFMRIMSKDLKNKECQDVCS